MLLAGRDDNLALHLAIRAALGRGAPAYPVVVVRGTYVGGVAELERLFLSPTAFVGKVALGAFERKAYGGPPAVLPHDAAVDTPFDPRRDARGNHWLEVVFQRTVFANAIRLLSLVHVALLVAAASLAPSGGASALVAVLIVDWLAFAALGPTPLAPLGVAATAAAWRVKGGAVPAIPYKVVFFLYALGAVGALADGSSSAMKAMLYSAASNSLLLAVFRF